MQNPVPVDQEIAKKMSQHVSLKERCEAYNGKLSLSEELPWGEPAGDEVRDEEKDH